MHMQIHNKFVHEMKSCTYVRTCTCVYRTLQCTNKKKDRHTVVSPALHYDEGSGQLMIIDLGMVGWQEGDNSIKNNYYVRASLQLHCTILESTVHTLLQLLVVKHPLTTSTLLLQLHCQQSQVNYCQLTRPFVIVKGWLVRLDIQHITTFNPTQQPQWLKKINVYMYMYMYVHVFTQVN